MSPYNVRLGMANEEDFTLASHLADNALFSIPLGHSLSYTLLRLLDRDRPPPEKPIDFG